MSRTQWLKKQKNVVLMTINPKIILCKSNLITQWSLFTQQQNSTYVSNDFKESESCSVDERKSCTSATWGGDNFEITFHPKSLSSSWLDTWRYVTWIYVLHLIFFLSFLTDDRFLIVCQDVLQSLIDISFLPWESLIFQRVCISSSWYLFTRLSDSSNSKTTDFL